ncbi:MAG TPA: TIGR02281 family clan AA aspartic protease [Allosphingosinicella sp.]|jgi:aspartyl protease family protein
MNWQALPIGIGIFIAMAWLRPSYEVPRGPQVQLMVAHNAPEEVRLKKRGNGHFYVHGMVNGQIVEFMVDTGASGVVLTVADAERVGLPVDRRRWQVIGSGASGPVRGQVDRLDSVEVEGRTVTNLDAMVAVGLRQSLLGQDFLRRFGSVRMSRDQMVLR